MLLLLNGTMISAQVNSSFFVEKNALETYPMLRQKDHEVIPLKKIKKEKIWEITLSVLDMSLM